jgi:DNA-binding response OmpR family regulator
MELQKRRILYIEDHDDTRELISVVFRQKGFEIVTDSSIENGIKLAAEQRFDLYLLDSWLPDGSGLELCRKIREFDRVTPILFYSAAAYEMDKDEALNSGAQGYIIKPSLTSDLSELVSLLIEEAALASEVVSHQELRSGPNNRRGR